VDSAGVVVPAGASGSVAAGIGPISADGPAGDRTAAGVGSIPANGLSWLVFTTIPRFFQRIAAFLSAPHDAAPSGAPEGGRPAPQTAQFFRSSDDWSATRAIACGLATFAAGKTNGSRRPMLCQPVRRPSTARTYTIPADAWHGRKRCVGGPDSERAVDG